MKENARVDRSAFARLAAMNPVPPSERGALVARLSEIKPRLPELQPPRRRRWKPPIVALAVVFVLAVGGVAVAASWDPLLMIGAADRPAEPTDTLSPAAKEQLRENEMPGGVIGTRLVDRARLLGELPNGRKVYAVPTSKGKLCLYVDDSAESCSDPLTRERPMTFTASKVGPNAPHVIWGAAADEVVSVSFTVAGEAVTVPVKNNFYVWAGQPTATMQLGATTAVTFSDGTTASAR